MKQLSWPTDMADLRQQKILATAWSLLCYPQQWSNCSYQHVRLYPALSSPAGAYWTPPTSRLFGGCHTNARLSGVVWSGITVWDWLIGPIWGCQVGYHDLGLTGRASESAASRSGVGIWGWHVDGHKTLEKTVLTKFFFFTWGLPCSFCYLRYNWLAQNLGLSSLV